MLSLEKMSPRTITSANYITSVNGMLHPTRRMSEHDFLYILDGTWEVIEEGISYELQTDDLLILCAGRHHTGVRLCNPGNRHMYFHVLPTEAERCRNKQQGLSERKERCTEQGKEKTQKNTQKICMDKMEAAESSEDPPVFP